MKQHVRPVLAALVLAATVLAAPPSRATAGPPLALSINGTLDFTLVSSNVVYPVLYEAYDFEGSLGDLGPVLGVAHEDINLLTANTEYLYLTSSFTIVTAGGDQLFGKSVGYIDQVYGTIHEIVTITGGTGAYRRASGSATGVGSLATGSEAFTGTVYLPR